MRKTALLGMLAAAVGAPYAASQMMNEPGGRENAGFYAAPRPTADTMFDEFADKLGRGIERKKPFEQIGGLGAVQSPAQMEQLGPSEVPVRMDLAECLWFGITPNDVMARWPRVASRMSATDLQGYRVPLVSGTRPDDLAGALTYFFDGKQQLRRITLRAQTADTSKIVAVLQSMHGFQYQPTTEPLLQLYQSLQSGKPRGQLWIRPAEIVRDRKSPHSFDVLLIMENR